MTPAGIRYTFDRDFDSSDTCVADAADSASASVDESGVPTAPPSPPAPMYDSDDLARARAEGFAEGHAAGLAAAADSLSRRVSNVLDAVAEQLVRLDEDRQRLEEAAAQRAVAVAVAIGRKLFPETSRRQALTEIEGMAEEVFARLARRPSLVVRVAPHLRDAAAERLVEVAARSGFAGELVVAADAALVDGDCRVDWGTGGAVRDTRALWREIEAIVEHSCEIEIPNEAEPSVDIALLPKPPTAADAVASH